MTEYVMRCRAVHLLIADAHLVRRLGRGDALPRDGSKSGASVTASWLTGYSIVAEETWVASSRMPGNISA